MAVQRRDFLKLGAGALAATAGTPGLASAAERNGSGCKCVLYDATRCLGCRACVTACRRRYCLEPTPDAEGLCDAPTELSPRCFSVISMYESADGSEKSFVRRQCMHCLEPACASACLVKALERTPEGPVVYHENKCIGCRYCMIACPFDVPRFEYEKAVPSIRKCPFCYQFVRAGQAPGCVEACPAGALQFGERGALLEEARARIYGKPDRYIHHIYGEHEVGGTARLYLAGVEFEKLGLPTDLPTTPLPDRTKGFLNSVPLVIILWAGFCTGLRWFVQRRADLAQSASGQTLEPTGHSENQEQPT